MKAKVQHPNITKMKKKVELESEVKLSKVVNPPKKSKVPLKEELLMHLKELQEKHDNLEKKSEIDIEIIETLKNANKKLSEEVKTLLQEVQNSKEEKQQFSKTTENEMHLKCYECSFVSSETSVIKHHLSEKHGWEINLEGGS